MAAAGGGREGRFIMPCPAGFPAYAGMTVGGGGNDGKEGRDDGCGAAEMVVL